MIHPLPIQVILSVLLTWLLCHVLTITDVFSSVPGESGHLARTDSASELMANSAWFRFPYPCQYNLPLSHGTGFNHMSRNYFEFTDYLMTQCLFSMLKINFGLACRNLQVKIKSIFFHLVNRTSHDASTP